MPGRPRARRYARAAFDIALEAGETERWLGDLQRAGEVVQDGALGGFLEMPNVPLARRLQALRGALGNAHPLVVNLMALLTSRRSVGLLPQIVAEYQTLLDVHHNRLRAEVVTAVALGDGQAARLSGQLAQMVGKEVVLASRVAPEILGGLVVRVDDRMIDGSLRGKLLALRKSLAEVPG